jgi:hypothetical protein
MMEWWNNGFRRTAMSNYPGFVFFVLNIPSFQHSIIPGGKQNEEAENDHKFNEL